MSCQGEGTVLRLHAEGKHTENIQQMEHITSR
jgi:hypothetical protein